MILLSYPISKDTPMYGNGPSPVFWNERDMALGDTCNTLSITLSNHSGTHIDFPFHFDPDGKKMSDYPDDFWFSECVDIIETDPVPEPGKIIDRSFLERQLREGYDRKARVVLIRTGWCGVREKKCFWENPPGIGPDVASFLRITYPDIRFLGVDLISISSFPKSDLGKEAHRAFLKHNHPILLIEDMNLSGIPANGIKNILISPLNIRDADGSPCNVFCNIGMDNQRE